MQCCWRCKGRLETKRDEVTCLRRQSRWNESSYRSRIVRDARRCAQWDETIATGNALDASRERPCRVHAGHAHVYDRDHDDSSPLIH